MGWKSALVPACEILDNPKFRQAATANPNSAS